MAKINYQNLPSTSTPLNATNLNNMQDIESTIDLTSYLSNGWADNGYCKASKINGIIFLTLSVRYGTTTEIMTLPSGYRPNSIVIVGTYNGSVGTNAVIGTNGKITLSDSHQVGANVYINAIYS